MHLNRVLRYLRITPLPSDRFEAGADGTPITRSHAQGAVVMSLDSSNSLMETVHLLRSAANAAHLQWSLPLPIPRGFKK